MLGFLSPSRRHAAQKAAVVAQRQSLLDADKRTQDGGQLPRQSGQGNDVGPEVPPEHSLESEYEEEGGVEDSESLHASRSTTGRGGIPTDAVTPHTAGSLLQAIPGSLSPEHQAPGFQFQDSVLRGSLGVHDSPTICPRLLPRAASQGQLCSSVDASAIAADGAALHHRSLSELVGDDGPGSHSSVEGGLLLGQRGRLGFAALQRSSLPLPGSEGSGQESRSTNSPTPLPVRRRGLAGLEKLKSQTGKPSRLHQAASLEVRRGSDTPNGLTRGRSATRQGDSFRGLGGRRPGASRSKQGLSEGGRPVGRDGMEGGGSDAAANILSDGASREEMAAFLSGESDGAASWRVAYGTSVSELHQMCGLEQGLRELRASIAAAAGDGILPADGDELGFLHGDARGLSPREQQMREDALRPLQLLHHAGFVELQLRRLAVDHAAVMATQSLQPEHGQSGVRNAEVAVTLAQDLADAAVAIVLEEKAQLQEGMRREAVEVLLGRDDGGSSLASSDTWDADGGSQW